MGLIWTLRIVTMPFRLVLALFILISGAFIVLPIIVIFTIGNPEDAIDVIKEMKEVLAEPELYRMILFGFR